MKNLKHLFIRKFPNETKELFDGIDNWKQFDKKLQTIARRLSRKRYLKFTDAKGDMFEVFVEFLILLTENDRRVNISNYTPVPRHTDNGVDGYGFNNIGEKCVISCKYRSNPTDYLTAGKDGLDSMMTEAQFDGVYLRSQDEIANGAPIIYRHFIFTSAKGLHHYTDTNKFRNQVKCYGIDDIKHFVDGNTNFWNNIRSMI